MNTKRNDRDIDPSHGQDRSASGPQRTGASSPDGDPRRQDGQDLRTAGGDDGRPRDDPSRAPESGTP